MEKLILRPYDKESMRMAMLKHEETFKEQVYELHRLYRIQKTLMKSIEISRSRRQNGNTILHDHDDDDDDDDENSRMRLLDLERPAAEEYYVNYINGAEAADDDEGSRRRRLDHHHHHHHQVVIDESEIELTLGPTPTRKKKHGTPLTSDSGPTSCFSSSSTEYSSHHQLINRTGSISKRHTNISTEQLAAGGILHLTDMTLGYQRQTGTNNNNNNKNKNVDDLQQVQLKQPPWLLQVLSMNMT